MQVTETSVDGLKREYHVVVPADELEGKVVSRLDELGRTIRLPGFRPGKIPMQILRRRYGPSVLGEVLESTVQDSSADTIREHNLRPALPPKFDVVSFGEGADLEYKMMVEVLPEIPESNFGDLDIERLVVEVPEESVDAAVQRIAEQQRKSEPVERPAADGDVLVVDVEGRIGDDEIPGAGGKDRQIMLGAGGFVPGFEEQLVGSAAGEHREVRVSFPEDYAASHLAGKEAVFNVEVKEVRERKPAVIDDELATAVGLENLAELRQELRQQMERDYSTASRLRLKRTLLDKLAERYDFEVPAGMVELEFNNIWAQHEAEQAREREQAGAAASDAGAAPDAEAVPAAGEQASAVAAEGVAVDISAAGEQGGAVAAEGVAVDISAAGEQGGSVAAEGVAVDISATGAAESGAVDTAGISPQPVADEAEEAAKAEYRKIAERRVRLGLLLAEVGRNNNITVTQDELNQAITREVRRHAGYERQALDFYRQNPDAVASLRAPIFEDKVVDFIVELAKAPERRVTPQELLALPDLDGDDAVAADTTATPAAEMPP